MKIKLETIVKKDSEHCLVSKKGKNLGCYDSEKGAEHREKQVQYFKHLKEEDVVEAIFQTLGETDNIQEMSAMGAGAVQGSVGAKKMDRETFLAELKLRTFIKNAIRMYEKKNRVQTLQTLKEEQKLRSVIRTLIKEAEEDRPHHSTGINVLSDLLKKIVPVLEIDYKKMTSSPTQRQSFRAHILKAAQNALDTEKVDDDAGDGGAESQNTTDSMMHEDSPEADISLDLEPEMPVDPEAEKFIDIERPSQKKAKKEKPDPMDSFGIEGEDETGRNIAMSSFQKVEKAIVESYSILSDPEDKRLFYDYLITNLKLYFDKFEDELKANVAEPGSETYDQEKGQQDLGSDQGLGQGL